MGGNTALVYALNIPEKVKMNYILILAEKKRVKFPVLFEFNII
jgi:hypothetical protein